MNATFLEAIAASVGGVLLCAGVAKMAVPTHLRRAVEDLAPRVGVRATLFVRVLATSEISTAVLLSIPATQRLGAVTGLVLGLGFATAGMTGAIGGHSTSCGCFGRAGGRPLGFQHIATGGALVTMSAVLLWRGPSESAAHSRLAMPGTAAVAAALAAWMHRDMIRDLIRPRGALAE